MWAMHHFSDALLWPTQCTLELSKSFISYTLSSTPVPVSSLRRDRRGEALGALLGNYLWVKTIIRYDTIRKAISSTTSACISLPHLWNMRTIRADAYANKMPPATQNYLSSFNRTHCFLMGGNRAGGGPLRSRSQTRQVIIHQLPAENDLRQEAHSHPPLAPPPHITA